MALSLVSNASAVFPACAGMFRAKRLPAPRLRCFPRVRGDVPRFPRPSSGVGGLSPRARGCSYWEIIQENALPVFPACAGMFPRRSRCWLTTPRFPRVRGDVPQSAGGGVFTQVFSPRARGCSSRFRLRAKCSGVFPACAGMFRLFQVSCGRVGCFPRVRGDVPRLFV